MSRPIAANPRRQQLNISLTDAEMQRIRARAAAIGMRPVHFGRALILNEQPVVFPVESNLMRLVYGHLARLGNNLNQIVRHLHQTGDPLPADLEPLLNDIRQIIEKVRR